MEEKGERKKWVKTDENDVPQLLYLLYFPLIFINTKKLQLYSNIIYN